MKGGCFREKVSLALNGNLWRLGDGLLSEAAVVLSMPSFGFIKLGDAVALLNVSCLCEC